MRRSYEIIDSELVVVKPWVNMCLVEDSCALGLREDKVEKETEPKPRIERYPN